MFSQPAQNQPTISDVLSMTPAKSLCVCATGGAVVGVDVETICSSNKGDFKSEILRSTPPNAFWFGCKGGALSPAKATGTDKVTKPEHAGWPQLHTTVTKSEGPCATEGNSEGPCTTEGNTIGAGFGQSGKPQ